eukprot:UN04811
MITPYASGCFLFDVCFPSNYPMGPCLVNLQTTGGGTIRFNPNLYNCGKVCLSLLGTWSGANQGEQWNPGLSNVSSSLYIYPIVNICTKTLFNEPGYEATMGTPDGDRRSREYNKIREVGTP